jgi:hypothetical protein
MSEFRHFKFLFVAAMVQMFATPRCQAAGDEERLKLDLDRLNGRWERTISDAKPPRKEVLLIDGDREKFLVEDENGKVIREWTARLALEIEGDVTIYTRSEIKLQTGDAPADPLPKSQSFIYRFFNGRLHELSGLLSGREGSRGEPAHVVWMRPGSRPKREPEEPKIDTPADGPDDPETRRDLELLQGRWERISRDESGKVVLNQQKVVDGNEETLTNRDANGSVRIFHVYEITMQDGTGAARTSPVDFSFVYDVDKKRMLDAPGVFQRRRSYSQSPALFFWVRPEPPDGGPKPDTAPDDAR